MATPITTFRSVRITPGNLYVGEGVPDTTLNGGDVHITGTLEVDGALNIDGAWSLGNTLTVGEDDTGYDVQFFGATSGTYLHWDESADSLLLVGAAAKMAMGSLASTAGSGTALSATTTGAFKVFADDGGAAIGSGTLTRAIEGRNLQTYTAGNREQEAAGVIGKLVSVAGTNRHNMCGVLGSYEVQTSVTVDGQAATTDTWCQAAVIGRVGGTLITVNANAVLAGVAAMSNVATALAANNGIYAGLYVGKWASTETWSHGLYIQHNAVDKAIQVGELSSDDQTGIHLTSTNPNVIDSFADDNNVTLGDANYANIRARTMLFKACTAGTIISVKGQIKFADEADMGPGVFAAVQGYMEAVKDMNVVSGGKFWGVDSSIDIPTTGVFTVDSGAIAAGLHAELTGAGQAAQSSGGILAGLYIDEQITTGNWGYGIYMVGTAVAKAIQVGTLSSDSQTGMTFVATTGTEAVSIYTDDGNAALTGGDPFVVIHGRSLFNVDQATGTTVLGVFGQLKYRSGVDIGPARTAAVEGYNEFMTTNIVKSGGIVAGVSSQTEITAGVLTVNSGGILAGVHAKLTGAGQITQDSGGIVAALYVDESVTTGQWGYGVYIEDAERAWYSTTTMTGATATDNVSIQVTDQQTNASGYTRGLYVNVTATGDKTSTGEINAAAIDLTPEGNAYIATPLAMYTGACADAVISNLWGIYMYMDDIGGSATVTTKYGMSIGIDNGDNATTCGYLRFYNHGAAGTDVDYVIDFPNAGISAAQYFFHAGTGGDMIETGDITSGKTCTHGLRVLLGSTPLVIPLYAD